MIEGIAFLMFIWLALMISIDIREWWEKKE